MQITSPKNGQTVAIWTEKQREFFTTDRSNFATEDFYYLDLKAKQKEDIKRILTE